MWILLPLSKSLAPVQDFMLSLTLTINFSLYFKEVGARGLQSPLYVAVAPVEPVQKTHKDEHQHRDSQNHKRHCYFSRVKKCDQEKRRASRTAPGSIRSLASVPGVPSPPQLGGSGSRCLPLDVLQSFVPGGVTKCKDVTVHLHVQDPTPPTVMVLKDLLGVHQVKEIVAHCSEVVANWELLSLKPRYKCFQSAVRLWSHFFCT
ncbi:hypothetical protein SELMODRAFT_413009 [Selaginella moellendorffii]|uniref:Uncharacterized protein n=1 Tax=Selaginella moellendorffii TaxID=88036 RepID=D8RN20_SELML|nr:hypothetical protein SELMODRAFT_413009 [Selaginella moellendorffii]